MRLIDADALIEEYAYASNDWDRARQKFALLVVDVNDIKDAPTIEPKRGEWIGYNADKGDDWLRSDGEPIFLVCNKCYGTVLNNTSAHWNFCPNCGARMVKDE